MSVSARRIAENEQRFRAFNEGAREVGETFRSDPRFTCECGDVGCTEFIDLSLDEYRHVRADARWFAVLPQHDRPDFERVVEHHEGHLIVQKIGEGAEIVA